MYRYEYDDIDRKPESPGKKIAVIFISLSFLVLALHGLTQIFNSQTILETLSVIPQETNSLLYPGKWRYHLNFRYDQEPSTVRLPKGEVTNNTVNLFSHPKVVAAMSNQPFEVRQQCDGPVGNIVVWKNQNLVRGDLLEFDGYTVFDLDCRDQEGYTLVAFIIIINMDGEIIAIHNPPIRAESVQMYHTDVVLFSCVNGFGSFLWNWKDDSVHKLPFIADAHTLQYRASDNKFYGCFLDGEELSAFYPTIAVAFDGETGGYTWAYEPEHSHINYITVYGDFAYLSVRTGDRLLKIDMRTNEIVWTLGSKFSDFHFIDHNGNFIDANKNLRNKFKENPADEVMFGTFHHQHKFQHLTEQYFSLFDNNVCSGTFCNSEPSRMLVIHLNVPSLTAIEIFSWPTGDQALLYGGADILPSGNLLGNSYHKTIYPQNTDYMFHSNIWEVTLSHELAWRVSFKGFNPWDPSDNINTYPHSTTPSEDTPVGWMIYTVERFHSKPVVSQLCSPANSTIPTLRAMVFNTIRTQEDMPGVLYLYSESLLVSKIEFNFQKSFFPVEIEVPVPQHHVNSYLVVVVVNSWEEAKHVQVGKLSELPACVEMISVSKRLPAEVVII